MPERLIAAVGIAAVGIANRRVCDPRPGPDVLGMCGILHQVAAAGEVRR